MAESVFHALGMPDADEEVARADLAMAIIKRLDDRKINNSDAVKFTGIARQEIIHLRAARLSRFTIDRLMKALNRLDGNARVKIVVEERVPGIVQ